MQAEMPFYEGPEDALKDAVRGLGGSKVVGPMLWPDKGIEASSRLLHDCLNPSRSEKLDISQIMLVLGKAKEIGIHSPFNFIAGEIGYEAKPITRAEEVDRLTSVIEQASKNLANALATLERVKAAA
jgi:hypothetical protein